MPTLFRVEGETVSAFAGPRLVLRLRMLIGPKRLVEVLQIVGAESSNGGIPANPGRRLFVRQATGGVLTGLAVLSGASTLHPVTAQAQADDMDADGAGFTDAATGWSINEMSQQKFNNFVDRANRDEQFTMIRRDFDDNNQRWARIGRHGWRFRRNGNFIREGYSIQYRNRNTGTLAVAQYVVEENGKTTRFGYIWRGGQVDEQLFVRNGNLKSRSRNGVVRDADFEATASFPFPDACTLAGIGCGAAQGLVVGTAGGAAAVGCGAAGLGPFGVGVCGGLVGGAVAGATDPVKEGCIDGLAGEDC